MIIIKAVADNEESAGTIYCRIGSVTMQIKRAIVAAAKLIQARSYY